jgi:polynucleotide 5'-kinase involved in rRNA processing
MDTTLVKDLSPRGFQWKTIVCVARIWEHRDQATWQNLFEVDFIVIDQEVPSKYSETSMSHYHS